MRVVRHTYPSKTTIGTWWLADGTPLCFTLEDELALAIPAGVHTIELSRSPRFGRDLPLIYSAAIPASRGIRVHRGRTHEHTEGCVLVGFEVRLDDPALGATAEAEQEIVRVLRELGGKTQFEIVEVCR